MAIVKICGITRYEDAKAAIDLGVSALGFNFYSRSPRFIHPKVACRIIEKVPETVWAVGLFVNTEATEVLRYAEEAGVDTLQFHGDENCEYLRKFDGYRRIKAVRVQGDMETKELRRLAECCEHLLFDSYDPYHAGGTGREINPVLLEEIKAAGLFVRAFLSGGITAQNVGAKIATYQPFGIDVASGVESKPGIKDQQKMRALMAALRKD